MISANDSRSREKSENIGDISVMARHIIIKIGKSCSRAEKYKKKKKIILADIGYISVIYRRYICHIADFLRNFSKKKQYLRWVSRYSANK